MDHGWLDCYDLKNSMTYCHDDDVSTNFHSQYVIVLHKEESQHWEIGSVMIINLNLTVNMSKGVHFKKSVQLCMKIKTKTPRNFCIELFLNWFTYQIGRHMQLLHPLPMLSLSKISKQLGK